MIRAKFECYSVKKLNNDSEELEFLAVTSDSEENRTWSKWTPSGNIKMTITNPDIFGKFIPGKKYYLDFTAE